MFVRSRWSMMFVLIITNHCPAQVISRCAGPFRVRNEDIIVSPPRTRQSDILEVLMAEAFSIN